MPKSFAGMRGEIGDYWFRELLEVRELAWGDVEALDYYRKVFSSVSGNDLIYGLMLSILQACPVAPYNISQMMEETGHERLKDLIRRFTFYCEMGNFILASTRVKRFPLYVDLQAPYFRNDWEIADPKVIDSTWVPGLYERNPLIGAGKPDIFGIYRLCARIPRILSSNLREIEYLIESSKDGVDLETNLVLFLIDNKLVELNEVLDIVVNMGHFKEERFASAYRKILMVLRQKIEEKPKRGYLAQSPMMLDEIDKRLALFS